MKYVESIRHSLTLLGQENLRRLFSLVILSTVTEDNPKELMLHFVDSGKRLRVPGLLREWKVASSIFSSWACSPQ